MYMLVIGLEKKLFPCTKNMVRILILIVWSIVAMVVFRKQYNCGAGT